MLVSDDVECELAVCEDRLLARGWMSTDKWMCVGDGVAADNSIIRVASDGLLVCYENAVNALVLALEDIRRLEKDVLTRVHGLQPMKPFLKLRG